MEVLDDTLRLKEERYVIYGGDVMHTDNLFGCNVTEHGDFGLGCGLKRLLDDQSAGNLQSKS